MKISHTLAHSYIIALENQVEQTEALLKMVSIIYNIGWWWLFGAGRMIITMS